MAPRSVSRRHASALETLSLTVEEEFVPIFEQALMCACETVGIFEADDEQKYWRIEGVKDIGYKEDELDNALSVARILTGCNADLHRESTEAEGWLARTYESFPEQEVGKRFTIRGTHLHRADNRSRLTITLDAGIAFGSGEHGSTRGCIRALEMVSYRKPQNILDMGCGSGILAMAAAKLLHQPVLAVDIEPWSVRTAKSNARLNGQGNLIDCRFGNGWNTDAVRSKGPYNLVFANILARPLCRMAKSLALNLAPDGTAILAGLLYSQANMVLAAHRRQGLILERILREGDWATLILRRRG
ncbi:50S ribosomal protein L11 methyltransferase [Swingsia samuiensis]|uniref:Ribosomal protein L11 methyltransferase n=1 Tax=Swingsia samuiensis TaxID=1293412 RepID=A0A4Y6UKH0_9PROT|nr:50S ribosomal protein L11 methyltransferase [Swingsia samuiensis]QDH18083.1 50S ribosomal protein L11 methyltransferase [Swingsia samuiensis]